MLALCPRHNPVILRVSTQENFGKRGPAIPACLTVACLNLRQQRDAIKALRVWTAAVGRARRTVSRGDGAAGIGQVGWRQIGRELQLLRAATQARGLGWDQNRSVKRVGAVSGISAEPWPSDGAQGGPSP